MPNISLKELRLFAKNRNINGYKSMPTGKLLRIMKEIQKKEEAEKSLYKPTKNSLFKLKRKKILYKPTKNNLFN